MHTNLIVDLFGQSLFHFFYQRVGHKKGFTPINGCKAFDSKNTVR